VIIVAMNTGPINNKDFAVALVAMREVKLNRAIKVNNNAGKR
jgi:hypothetical protein